MKKVTVVGAGFAGLTLARELLARGVHVEVLEKSSRPGGLIGSYKTPYGLVETGATSILLTDKVQNLCEELGVDVLKPSPESKKRFFYVKDGSGGHLARWPLKVFETAALAAHFAKARIRKTLKPEAGETIAQWGKRNLGKPVVDRLISPALQGIYAADAERLSASLVLGPMFNRKKKSGGYRGVIAPKGGMFSIIHALEDDIMTKGGVIHYNHDVTSVAKPMVVATSAPAAADLLRNEDVILAKRIDSLKSSPLVSVTAFFKEPTGLKAFGCLVPRNAGVRTLGVLLNHAIFPGRDSQFGETWILGGATDESIIDLKDPELKDLLMREREILFGKTDEPVEMKITRWAEGLPNYDLVLEDVLKDLTAPKGVWLHGNWLGGIGLSKILERSEILAEKIARELA